MLTLTPKEINLTITSYLDRKALEILACVSKHMYELVNETWAKKIDEIKKDISMQHKYLTGNSLDLFVFAQLGLIKRLKEAISQGASVNSKLYLDKENNIFITPLHMAAYGGHLDCVKLLIKQGVIFKPDGQISYYLSPLHYAAAGGQTACVEYFLSKNEDIGLPLNVNQQSTISCPLGWNWTPLQMAASGGYLNCVRLLLEKGADVNFKDPDEYQSIHRACQNGHPAVLDLLLEHSADPNAVNEDGITPLLNAIDAKNTECVIRLLKYNVDIKNPSSLHRFLTPLQIAINIDALDIAEILLKHDPSLVNGNSGGIQNSHYPTPLHLAAYNGNLKAVELLLSYSADATIKSRNGKTAQDLASEKKHESIVLVLEQHINKPEARRKLSL